MPLHVSEPERENPAKEVPQPAVPPEMQPVMPVEDPPPGRAGDEEPPPVIT